MYLRIPCELVALILGSAKHILGTALLYDSNMSEIVKVNSKVKTVLVPRIKEMCVEYICSCTHS